MEEKIWRILDVLFWSIVLAAVNGLITVFPFIYLWNWTATRLCGFKPISFTEALAILIFLFFCFQIHLPTQKK
jgi:hypothetical protein